MEQQLENEMAALRGKIRDIDSQVNELRLRLVTQTGKFLHSWYRSEADSQVKHNDQLTRSLGKEKLSPLKEEVVALQENSSHIARKFLDDSSIWWKPEAESKVVDPQPVVKAIRIALGELAPILEKYGYGDPPLKTRRIVWQEQQSSAGSWERYNRTDRSALDIELSGEMNSILNEYSGLCNVGQLALGDLRRLKREKEKKAAEDLWESA